MEKSRNRKRKKSGLVPESVGSIEGQGTYPVGSNLQESDSVQKTSPQDPESHSDGSVVQKDDPMPSIIPSIIKNDFLIFPNRGSHFRFLKSRNWKAINNYWHSITHSGIVPDWISSPSSHSYGVTDLQAVHQCALDEIELFGTNIQRKTYAVRVGYAGSHYQGYQSQGGKKRISTVVTVEDDIREAVGRSSMAAGRTDKGVSALSQVISFFINKDDLPEDDVNILERMRNHPAVKEGRLAFFDCQIVPKKFHALFSATWRRYMYLYPLNDPQSAKEFDELSKGINEQKGDDEENEERGEKFVDECPLEDVIYYPAGTVREGVFTQSEEDLNRTLIDVDIPYLNEMLARITNKSLHFNGFAYKEIRGSDEVRGDECILYVARAFLVDISSPATSQPQLAVCIELVGNRFLRRMATLIRESQIPRTQRQPEILEKICENGCRERAAFPAPAAGLCMTGVGYDLEDLSKSKFLPTNPKTIARNKRKKEERERKLLSESSESAEIAECVTTVIENISSTEKEKKEVI